MRPLLFLLLISSILSGCTSHVVEVDINNHLAAPVRNIEVSFGGGTYGRSSIAASGTHHNRIKIFSLAPIQVQFDDPAGKHITTVGPQLAKNAEGTLSLTIDDSGAHWSSAAK